MDKKNMIYRVPLSVRFCHVFIVICFLLAALSGLSLFFPSLHILGSVLGTPQLVRVLHPFMGLTVFILLIFMLIKLVKHNIPNKDDIRWLKNIDKVIAGKEPEDIPIGKYNAGQKFLFWCIMSLISVLVITGLIMWRRYFADYFPIPVVRIAIMFHSIAAIALMLLIIGHAYMAIWVKGSIKGMIVGYVSRAWARKNHSQWYAEEMEKVYAKEAKELEKDKPIDTKDGI
ncbi:formate dehydrogenase subunit gamma [Utexia brackfieldae]|uniref:formate dehydrogenase subunit gamma n=1 Tax=Utexia brackfieldae TaxID=3074108 RepID=UPI00370DD2EA